jgi:hypothetical protein
MITLQYTLQDFITPSSNGKLLQELVFVLLILLIFGLYDCIEHGF